MKKYKITILKQFEQLYSEIYQGTIEEAYKLAETAFKLKRKEGATGIEVTEI